MEVLKASPQMAAAMLKVQYKLQVAPRSVASPVAWVVQALQGQWVLPAVPGEVRRKPPPKAVSAWKADWLARHDWGVPLPTAALPGT